MSVTVVIELLAKDGMRDALADNLSQARTFCMSVDGCERFDVLRDQTDDAHFLLVEVWESEEKHERHFVENIVGSGMLDELDALGTQTARSLWNPVGDQD